MNLLIYNADIITLNVHNEEHILREAEQRAFRMVGAPLRQLREYRAR